MRAKINSVNFELLKGERLPGIQEQCDNLVLWLAAHLKAPGRKAEVNGRFYRAIMGAESILGFEFVVGHLKNSQLVDISDQQTSQNPRFITYALTLSVKGWLYAGELLKGSKESRVAFMAMKYGDAQLDRVVLDVFRPAVAQTGFELRLLTDNQAAGLIDDQLRVEIRRARFLIADLTHENPGAYWESGFAEGLGRPVIYTCEKEKFSTSKTHFDTNHHLTILWDKAAPHLASEPLKATIRATLPSDARMSD